MVKQGLKASTADAYEQISKQIWKDHFIGRTFREYEPHRGNKVDGLVTRKYGRRTLAHVSQLGLRHLHRRDIRGQRRPAAKQPLART